jgi:hypothetical protein
MLRYWSAGRTLWLADVFGHPSPLNSPDTPSPHTGDTTGELPEQSRQERDLAVLNALLGR